MAISDWSQMRPTKLVCDRSESQSTVARKAVMSGGLTSAAWG